jgi:hypothetical protein
VAALPLTTGRRLQILSDLFRRHGYDSTRYKSLLGPGYN